MKLLKVTKSLHFQPHIKREYTVLVENNIKQAELNKIIQNIAYSDSSFQYMTHNINYEFIEDDIKKEEYVINKLAEIQKEYETIQKQRNVLINELNTLKSDNIENISIQNDKLIVLFKENGEKLFNI